MIWTSLSTSPYVADYGKEGQRRAYKMTLLLQFAEPIGDSIGTSGYSSGLNQLIPRLRKRLVDRKITDLFELRNSVPLKVNIRRIKNPLN